MRAIGLKIFLLLSGIGMLVTAYGQQQVQPPPLRTNSVQQNPNVSQQKTKTQVASNKNYITMYCLPADKLELKNMFWGAPGDWRSYNQSFVKHISHFSGAQWRGVEEGTLICLYQGVAKFTFPVALNYGKIVKDPSGGRWSKDLGGYKDCISTNIYDCPFEVKKPKKIIDIFKQLKYLGPKAADNDN